MTKTPDVVFFTCFLQKNVYVRGRKRKKGLVQLYVGNYAYTRYCMTEERKSMVSAMLFSYKILDFRIVTVKVLNSYKSY